MASDPKTFREAILYFADYDNCRKAVEAIRWPDGKVTCPTCGSENVTWLDSQKRYKCYVKHPRAQFSLKVGTIFEDSALGFENWLPALWLLSNCEKGISSYELARALGVTQKSAWFMLSRLRLALQDGETGGKLSGPSKSMKPSSAARPAISPVPRSASLGISMGVSMRGKVAVMGLLERHRERGHSRIKLLGLDGRQKRHRQTPFVGTSLRGRL